MKKHIFNYIFICTQTIALPCSLLLLDVAASNFMLEYYSYCLFAWYINMQLTYPQGGIQPFALLLLGIQSQLYVGIQGLYWLYLIPFSLVAPKIYTATKHILIYVELLVITALLMLQLLVIESFILGIYRPLCYTWNEISGMLIVVIICKAYTIMRRSGNRS